MKLTSKRQRRLALTAMGLISFLLAYVFGSVALDTARYWFYISTLISTWAGIWFIGRAVKNDKK